MFRRLAEFVRTPQPPPKEPPAVRFLWGLSQPALGARLLLQDRALLADAIKPALLLAGFCALTAWMGMGPGKSFLGRFYQTFALLAPLPSVVFARHYARMAASVRRKLGFGPCLPKREPLHVVLMRAGAQALLVAGGMLPILVVLKLVPGLGATLAKVLAALWALQWVVVDAFDDARVMKPGETQRDLDRNDRNAPRPWFVRFFYGLKNALWGPFGAVAGWFGKIVDRLSVSWREEMAMAEKHPAIAAGFALTTAALLATPVLNLFFRPIIIVASSHVRGEFERTEPAPQVEERPSPVGQLTPVPPSPQ